MARRRLWRTRTPRLAPALLLAGALTACSHARMIAAPSQFALVYRAPSGNVVLASVDGAGARRLGVGTQALLAPNGSRVAALSNGGTASLTIYQTEIAKHAERVLSHVALRLGRPDWSGEHVQLLAWSPDSRLLALSADSLSANGEQPELLVLNTVSDTLSTIAAGDFLGASFAPGLPDRLVYAAASIDQLDDNTVPLFTASANGSDRRQLTRTGLAADPVWGAAGIVFARLSRLGSPTSAPRYQLWLIGAHGRGLRRLTHIAAGPPVPDAAGAALSLSASGTRLVANFASPNPNVSAIDVWTVELARARTIVHRLTFNGAQFIAQGLSRRGGRILLSALDSAGKQAAVESLPWAGGQPGLLVAGGAGPSWNR
jgi:Tol biopolymer transport system component